MYSLEAISNEKDDFQKAVLNARAFKPLSVKIKANDGSNLKGNQRHPLRRIQVHGQYSRDW